MNDPSPSEIGTPGPRGVSATPSTVIKPWLAAGLIIALAGNVLLSAVLIVKLGGFEDTKKRAEEIEAETVKKRTELSSLQTDVESLTQRKGILEPTVADWETRITEKAEAQAAVDSLEAKRRQAESDVAQASKRLEDSNRILLEADRQRTELTA